MLQNAFADGMVVAREEGRGRSAYEVLGLEREVRLTFQPRADAEHFVVALASMLSKYLREVLMGEFNAFWQGRVVGLKATAGYPRDALRFFEQIRAAAAELGIAEAALWRRR
jgi:ribonuclease HII